MLVWRMMDPDHSPSVYVDVGCNHPYHMSNSAFFYERGWTGIAIDPNPSFKDDFERLRPLDHFVNCGVGEEEATLEYFYFEEPLYNTFDSAKAATINGIHSKLLQTQAVPIRRLDSILIEYWPEGKQIRWMSIDAEGMDLQIVKSHDFDLFPVEFICVEVNSLDLERACSDEVVCELRFRGFIPIAKLCKSAILINSTFADRWGLIRR
ncbi:hypothetical protein Pla52n_46390 [Stieleria varia]|uniref:Methyltransferase FkbM domain-containing protein n=1 Tax=Stieleria varia TaxID=2528005 RepID=A0A5C6AMM4_9BACT|nr:hypothetical protein Pla52n_46390 [Stieleria varia]